MQLTTIQNKIYEIRGHKVMLDFDLAIMYGIQNRVLKQAVKRNINRFPEDFMFQLTNTEWKELITTCDNLPKGIKFSPATPFAFTEHGVTMLASVLRSDEAIAMNIAIVRAFVALRQFAQNYKELAEQIKELQKTTGNHDKHLTELYQALNLLLQEKEEQTDWKNRKRIGYKARGK